LPKVVIFRTNGGIGAVECGKQRHLEEAEFCGLGECLRAAIDIELAVDVAGGDFHCADRKHQPPGNLTVGESLGNQPQHLSFTFTQRFDKCLICCGVKGVAWLAEERTDDGFKVLVASAFPGALIYRFAKLMDQVGTQACEERPAMQPSTCPGWLSK